MTTVKIKSLSIANFKGVGRLDKAFDKRQETVRARNGAGKTTLMYAWQWVLGMDVPDVIPRIDNKELHNLETKVAAVITINDLEYKLSRTLTEEWKTNREKGIEEKHTNISAYKIDDVEFAATKYKDKLAQLFGVPYDKLEMFTNEDYFNSDRPPKWTWTARRKELFEISGAKELLEGLAEKSDYDLIRDDLRKGFSTAEIRKAKMKALKGCTDAKDRNMTLIEDKQADLSKYTSMNFAALEAQKAGYEAQITELNLILIKTENSGDKAQIKAKIDTLIRERTQLVMADANERARIKNVIDTAHFKLQLIANQGRELKSQIIDIADIEKRVSEKRALKWSGDTICPTCGQPLPEEKVMFARAEWENAVTSDVQALEEKKDKGQETNATIELRLYGLRSQYKELESEENLAIAELDNYVPNPRITALDAEISALKASNAYIPPDDGGELVYADLLQSKTRLEEIQKQLAYKQVAADLKARVEQLKAENRQLTDQEMVHRAGIRALDAYVAEQVSLITDSINSLFGAGVSWALFTEQYAGAESELKETCVCMLDGKVYTSLSTGERFLANYEVVRALQASYGVSLPIFCDNAECFTGALTDVEQQVIMLCASAGEEIENCTQVQKETL